MVNIKNTSRGSFWIGIILVALGSIFIADNLDLLPYEIADAIFKWQFILIIVGLVLIFNSKDKLWGFITAAFGVIFLLRDYYYFSIGELFRDYWPVILIIVGLSILFKRKKYTSTQNPESNSEEKSGSFFHPDTSYDDDTIDQFEIFSGGPKHITSQNFRGGKITSLMAGPDYDFHNAKLAEGTNILEITVLFAGLELDIPNDWNVIINISSIFGGVDDKRKFITKIDDQAKGTLVIKGIVLFGGTEIKN